MTSKVLAAACGALVFSATAAFAQAGGPDVPGGAKKAGAVENGSSSTGMKKDGAMTKGGSAPQSGGRGSETGGNAGGPANKN